MTQRKRIVPFHTQSFVRLNRPSSRKYLQQVCKSSRNQGVVEKLNKRCIIVECVERFVVIINVRCEKEQILLAETNEYGHLQKKKKKKKKQKQDHAYFAYSSTPNIVLQEQPGSQATT
jgi:hypothetical protein